MTNALIRHLGNFSSHRFKYNFLAFPGDWAYSCSHCSVNIEVFDLNWRTSRELVFEDGERHECTRRVERVKTNLFGW